MHLRTGGDNGGLHVNLTWMMWDIVKGVGLDRGAFGERPRYECEKSRPFWITSYNWRYYKDRYFRWATMIDGAKAWQYMDQQVETYVYEFDAVDLFNIERTSRKIKRQGGEATQSGPQQSQKRIA